MPCKSNCINGFLQVLTMEILIDDTHFRRSILLSTCRSTSTRTLTPSNFTDLYLVCELCLQNDERRTKRRFDTRSTDPIRDKHTWPREREDKPIPLFEHFADKRAAAKSLACRIRAIEDTWDEYDRLFYSEWLNVTIEPTRFID